MVTHRWLALAIVLVACGPTSRAAADPTETAALTPDRAGNVSAASAATASGCNPSVSSAAEQAPFFVALADRGGDGVAFVLDRSTGDVHGRVEIRGAEPEAAVDWTGNRLLLFCSDAGKARLVAYDLHSLREQWQIGIDGRSITKVPGGLPAIAVGADGRLVFVLHYRTLRPGDANAPGTSVTWLTAHDARTGAEEGRVDFPDCVAARIFVASDSAPYVMCRDQLYAIDTSTWTVARTFPFTGSVGPVGINGDRSIYGVTRDLQVQSLDLRTGATTVIGKGNGARAQGWGRLTMTPSGLTLWVIARASEDRAEYDPDTLAVLSLSTWSVFETRIPGLRGVGLVGTRVVYGVGGAIRSTDGAINQTLIDGRVDYWHFFGEAK